MKIEIKLTDNCPEATKKAILDALYRITELPEALLNNNASLSITTEQPTNPIFGEPIAKDY